MIQQLEVFEQWIGDNFEEYWKGPGRFTITVKESRSAEIVLGESGWTIFRYLKGDYNRNKTFQYADPAFFDNVLEFLKHY